MAEITKGTTYYLETLVLDQQGNPATGLTMSYKVIRSSDNSVLASGSLSHIGDGVYQNSYLFDTNGQFRILYIAPNDYKNDIETINVADASSTAVSNMLKRVLGLCHENFRVEQPVYNKAGDLTDGIIKIYDNASDLENDINPIAVYDVKTEYKAGKNRRLVNEYTCKRIA
jgi:hypothetical protein